MMTATRNQTRIRKQMERLVYIDPITLLVRVKEEEKQKRQKLFTLAKENDPQAIETLKREYNLTRLILNGKTVF